MKYNPQSGTKIKNLNLPTWTVVAMMYMLILLLILPACSKKEDKNLVSSNNDKNPTNGMSNCKDKPGQLSYGITTFDLTYNQQGNPVTLTSNKVVSVLQPSSTVSVIYTIQYDSQGKLSKISKMKDLKPDGYFVPGYNANGQMIKLAEYDAQGREIVFSTADFDVNRNISSKITHIEGDAIAQTCRYRYSAGNLVEKSIQHFYDPVSTEFIDADISYDYYTDKIKKEKILFTGMLGLRIMADFADSESIYYIPNAQRGQLLFAQEAAVNKNMLKHIKATAHRYNKADDTDVDYTYGYDAEGTVEFQKGNSHNVITRSEPSPFGGTVNVTLPVNYSFEITIDYKCQ